MKIGVYFLLGTIISSIFKTSCDDSTATDHCATTTDDIAWCYKNDQHKTPFIPGNIPSTIKTIVLYHEHSNTPWLIQSSETFKKFKDLNNLIIRSSMQFSPVFETPQQEKQITNELFNLSTLTNLTVSNCKFEGVRDAVFTLPSTLERLTWRNSSAAEFKLSNCPKLQHLTIEYSDLKTIPKLYFAPPPPLRTLVVKNNPSLRLKVDDIANLCNLSQVSFDVMGTYLGSPEGYCECIKLQNWKRWLNDFNRSSIFDPKEWRCSSSARECLEKDSLENAKENYEKQCLGKYAQSEITEQLKRLIGLWAYIIPAVIIILTVILALVMTAFARMKPLPELADVDDEETEEVEEELQHERIEPYVLIY
ncbi:uncharacterized protein LOC135834768 [Planococcus citri]|uniref:uncharacterized protein LOC135834768 n=1 Tax=Planococcus citri TaxID=170843 RepID=UPI0031F8A740